MEFDSISYFVRGEAACNGSRWLAGSLICRFVVLTCRRDVEGACTETAAPPTEVSPMRASERGAAQSASGKKVYGGVEREKG